MDDNELRAALDAAAKAETVEAQFNGLRDMLAGLASTNNTNTDGDTWGRIETTLGEISGKLDALVAREPAPPEPTPEPAPPEPEPEPAPMPEPVPAPEPTRAPEDVPAEGPATRGWWNRVWRG